MGKRARHSSEHLCESVSQTRLLRHRTDLVKRQIYAFFQFLLHSSLLWSFSDSVLSRHTDRNAGNASALVHIHVIRWTEAARAFHNNAQIKQFKG